MNKLTGKLGSFALNLIILLFTLSCVVPFIWMMYSGLKTEQEFAVDILSLPRSPQWNNYSYVFGKMGGNILNSAINSVMTVLAVTLLSYIAGYFLSRFEFKLRNALYMLFMFGMLVPIIALMIPVFIQFKNAGMLDNRLTLFVVYVAVGMPMSVFLIESFVVSIPTEMEEAAAIDGCSLPRTMFAVVFPLCLPVIATVLILGFMNAWNEFPFALVLISSEKYRTLPVSLRNFNSQYTTNYTKLMAALTIATLPVILLYLFAHRKIIVGMTSGSIKG